MGIQLIREVDYSSNIYKILMNIINW